jgi:hypothetical protein
MLYTKKGLTRPKIIEGKSMPKLTVFAKKETGNQIGIDSSSETSLLSTEKKDLLEINLFDSEKTDQCRPDQTPQVNLVQKFNECLIQAVDEALTSLGEPVKNTVYFQLENNFNITKNEIPCQIEEFIDILHKIFGLGASRLEIKFMKNLHSRIKVSVEINGYEWPLSKWIIEDMSFTEYVQRARENYCSSNKDVEMFKKQDVSGN